MGRTGPTRLYNAKATESVPSERRGLPPALTLQPLQGLSAPGRAAAAKKMSALSILSIRYLSPSLGRQNHFDRLAVTMLTTRATPQIAEQGKLSRSGRRCPRGKRPLWLGRAEAWRANHPRKLRCHERFSISFPSCNIACTHGCLMEKHVFGGISEA
jgi:hypothetical protein